MKKYLVPSMTIMCFDSENIVTASGTAVTAMELALADLDKNNTPTGGGTAGTIMHNYWNDLHATR